jgi:uncharacterized membrane protein YidH (DUF202 family)
VKLAKMKAKARSMTTVRKTLRMVELEPTEKEKEMRKLVAALIMLAGATMILFGRYVLIDSFFLFLLTGLGVLAAGMYRFERIKWHERKERSKQERQLASK